MDWDFAMQAGTTPGTNFSTMKEYLDLVDRENRVLGKELRSRVRAENLLHRGVGILCWNSKGQLYVHQRTSTKDVFPSMYDMMVGGAVEAGEEYVLAAAREVHEELGVESTPRFILEHLYEGPRNRSWVQLFEVFWEGPIEWQESEICWGRWMDFERVLSWIEEVPVVPDGLEVFQQFLRSGGGVSSLLFEKGNDVAAEELGLG